MRSPSRPWPVEPFTSSPQRSPTRCSRLWPRHHTRPGHGASSCGPCWGALGILATTIAWGFADGIVQALGAGDESVAAELVGPYVLATALLAIAHLLAAVDVAAGGCRAAHIMVAAGVLQAAMVIAAAHDVPAVLDIRIGVAAVLVAVQARRSLRPTEVSS